MEGKPVLEKAHRTSLSLTSQSMPGNSSSVLEPDAENKDEKLIVEDYSSTDPRKISFYSRKKLKPRRCLSAKVMEERGDEQEIDRIHPKQVQDIPYVCIRTDNGRLAWQCKATDCCPKRFTRIWSKCYMQEHLLKEHGIDIKISRAEKSNTRASEVSAYEKNRYHARFQDAERKWKRNKKKYEKEQTTKAWKNWNALPDEEKSIGAEVWVNKFVAGVMSKYEAQKAQRMECIQRHINQGYQGSAHLAEIRNIVSDVVHERTTSRPHVEECTAAHDDCTHGLIDDQMVIDIESKSPWASTTSSIVVEVLAGRVKISPSIAPTPHGKIMYTMSCERLGLSEEVESSFLDTFLEPRSEATTQTFSFFTMYMEYSMPLEIGQRYWIMDPLWGPLVERGKIIHINSNSRCDFLFLPLVKNGHWSLFIVINTASHGIHKLGQHKGVIFLDSLNLGPTKEMCRAYIRIVRSIWKDDPCGQEILASAPIVRRSPQQPNSYDCGFYVMTSIKAFVEACLRGIKPKNFLRHSWYSHDGVLELKSALLRWTKSLFHHEVPETSDSTCKEDAQV